jgi:putative resolvase
MEEAGKLKALRLPSGRRRFQERDLVAVLRQRGASRERAAIYARQVDSGNLERQIERLRQVADARGFDVAAVIAEQASGLNERRRGLRKLFRLAEAGEIDVVLVEFKDRLARFG